MLTKRPLPLDIAPEVATALENHCPIVAFETTILTFGLPQPLNRDVALGCEERARSAGTVPATIAMMDGRIKIGLTREELDFFCSCDKSIQKVNPQNFAATLCSGKPGAFTVGASLLACSLAGIRVFCTGGIGGVHRGWQLLPDISSDLHALSKYPVVTVSAGAKSILDIPSTLEVLETLGVPVCGWQTDRFPLFHCPESDYAVSTRLENATEVARLADSHFALTGRGLLLTAPIPQDFAIERSLLETWIITALNEADESKIRGRNVTPFLLARLEQHSQGRTLVANQALIFNNASVAAQVSVALTNLENTRRNETVNE